jgi:hypothetical protein
MLKITIGDTTSVKLKDNRTRFGGADSGAGLVREIRPGFTHNTQLPHQIKQHESDEMHHTEAADRCKGVKQI